MLTFVLITITPRRAHLQNGHFVSIATNRNATLCPFFIAFRVGIITFGHFVSFSIWPTAGVMTKWPLFIHFFQPLLGTRVPSVCFVVSLFILHLFSRRVCVCVCFSEERVPFITFGITCYSSNTFTSYFLIP
jgi:hypothetical protein